MYVEDRLYSGLCVILTRLLQVAHFDWEHPTLERDDWDVSKTSGNGVWACELTDGIVFRSVEAVGIAIEILQKVLPVTC
jgi:hypothetical protein